MFEIEHRERTLNGWKFPWEHYVLERSLRSKPEAEQLARELSETYPIHEFRVRVAPRPTPPA
jgi:hypothetical protein